MIMTYVWQIKLPMANSVPHVSHVESSAVNEVIQAIDSQFGKITVIIGVNHKYVGIEIEFTGDCKVTLLQKGHLLECIEAFGEDDITHGDSPAQKGIQREYR